jgi:hypothetical protein
MSTDTAPGGFRPVNPPPPSDAGGVKIPLRRGTRKATRIPADVKGWTVSRIQGRLKEAISTVAAFASLREPFDGSIIFNNADKLAEAYAPLIERDKRLLQFFAQLEKGGAYGAAITVTIGVAIPILIHHGKVPDSWLYLARVTGVIVPDNVPVKHPMPAPEMTQNVTRDNILA